MFDAKWNSIVDVYLGAFTVDFIFMCIQGIYNSTKVFICTNINTFHFCSPGVVLHSWTDLSSSMQLLHQQHSFQTTFLNSDEGVQSSPDPPCLNPLRIWVPCGWRSALVLLSWKRLLINNSWLDNRKNLAKLESRKKEQRNTRRKWRRTQMDANALPRTKAHASNEFLILTWTYLVPREIVLV